MTEDKLDVAYAAMAAYDELENDCSTFELANVADALMDALTLLVSYVESQRVVE